MAYQRRLLHYSPGPTNLVGEISNRVVAGAWFELHRQGGCGAGEIKLNDDFSDRANIALGDWIAFEFSPGDRWYLGRVENRQAISPGGAVLELQGMSVQLAEAFPGGFDRNVADGIPPHRYAFTDIFPNDPDHTDETVDTVSEPTEVVGLLLDQYIVPKTDIIKDLSLIEEPSIPSSVTTMKFRGEESTRDIVEELAIRSKGASWGVNEDGKFFFLKPVTTVQTTFQESVDLIAFRESVNRNLIYNRVLLTGGFIYDAAVSSNASARGFFRWKGNYIQPASRDTHGERQIRLSIPWIRTREDSREFIREFFRIYADPPNQYAIEVANQSSLLRPWDGEIKLLDQHSNVVASQQVETIRVEFDHAPRFQMILGAIDPMRMWPQPNRLDRWELRGPMTPSDGGEIITFSSSAASSSGSGTITASGSLTGP